MIIKKITIENYLCYYGVKEFELSSGLNIILGENGEGKTKFFEAIEWLFNGDEKGLNLLVSSKKLHETQTNESFRVRVSIIVEQHESKKTISKSFNVKKSEKNECIVSNFFIEGVEENKNGERDQVDGRLLLDRVFPFQIRTYSMFKGESELDIFKSEGALTNLINLFSDAKHYEKYAKKGDFLLDKAEKAVHDDSSNNKKNQAQYNKLESEILGLENHKKRIEVALNSTQDQIDILEEEIQLAEKHVNNADALETINKRIQNAQDRISSLQSRIEEKFTTSLFDEKWILVHFEKIHKEFSDKTSSFSVRKRQLQTEFDKEIGKKEGEKKAKEELLSNLINLPIGVPSKVHMEEMIAEEFCKVCNRPAEKGSAPYEFMLARLEAYLKSQTPVIQSEQKQILFHKNYVNRLESMSVSHEDGLYKIREIEGNIKDRFEFISDRKKDILKYTKELDKELEEREKIIGSSSIGADKLVDVLKNYNSWQSELAGNNKDFGRLKNDLDTVMNQLKAKKIEKDKVDLSSANSFLIKTRAILRDVKIIFDETKENKFDQFIKKLETKANTIFTNINIDSFTGEIVITRKNTRDVVKIELHENGRIFHKPNQSLLTSMHISILFAISELAFELREERYPMIFDAPTSSFGENKTSQFLNLIYETSNQKILLLKDFLVTDRNTNALSIKTEFEKVKRDKAFWVKIDRPFDHTALNTINTKVINL